jgi:hypothetical protein
MAWFLLDRWGACWDSQNYAQLHGNTQAALRTAGLAGHKPAPHDGYAVMTANSGKQRVAAQ